jgi:tetratricopeptide (TPR) repeat protein
MLEGMLDMLDWKWKEAEEAFQNSIASDPGNLKARHWYSLYLSAMGQFDLAMAQSDTITTLDPLGQYLIGRGSLLYFARRNEEFKELMIKVVAMDTWAWGYDWLGMAYVELKEYEKAIETYFKAFELSDGTVEVGAGLGHALGMAGEYETAKQMARFYAMKSEDHYLPPVQRSFIHIGIGEYDRAIELLEQGFKERSWFLIFIQSEPLRSYSGG